MPVSAISGAERKHRLNSNLSWPGKDRQQCGRGSHPRRPNAAPSWHPTLCFPEPFPRPTRRNLKNVRADDHRLIEDCLQGSPAAFGVLVSRYQDRLFNTVYRLVGNPEDAADVVQEAFLSAYQSLGSFKGDAQFFTWLYRIAVNAAITHRRKQRGGLQAIKTSDSAPGIEPLDPAPASRPGHHLEMEEDERRVHEALQRLSSEHRAVLIMKDMEDMKYEEMAEVLGVPVGTIRSRLHRARLEIKEILEREDRSASP